MGSLALHQSSGCRGRKFTHVHDGQYCLVREKIDAIDLVLLGGGWGVGGRWEGGRETELVCLRIWENVLKLI